MEVEPLARIVVIWRRDSSYVNYEWLGKWEADNLTQNIAKLESSIDRILKSSQELAYDAIVKVGLLRGNLCKDFG